MLIQIMAFAFLLDGELASPQNAKAIDIFVHALLHLFRKAKAREQW